MTQTKLKEYIRKTVNDDLKANLIIGAVEAYSSASNNGKPIVSGRSEQLFCHNCHVWHTNEDYDGYCCQSCLDGVEAK